MALRGLERHAIGRLGDRRRDGNAGRGLPPKSGSKELRLACSPTPNSKEARTNQAFVLCAATLALVASVSCWETKRTAQAQATYDQAADNLALVTHREARIRTVANALHTLGFVAHTVETNRALSYAQLSLAVEVGNLVPSGVWLEELSQNQDTLTLKGGTEHTALLGVLLHNLAQEHNLAHPQIVSMKTATGTATMNFTITSTLTNRFSTANREH